MQIQVNLKAGKRVRQAVVGTYFVLMETGTAGVVELGIYRGAAELEYLRTARRGFKARTSQQFTAVELTSAVDTTVEIIISEGEVDVASIDGMEVAATITGLPLPVELTSGATPGDPLYVSGLTLSDTPAASLGEPAQVAVNTGLTAMVAANPARRGLRFYNQGPDPVALGAGSLTWARRAIVIEAGDTWVEERAANLAWSARTGTGTATVGIQEVLS